MTLRRRAFSALLPAAFFSAFGRNVLADEIFISDTHSHSTMNPRNEACLSCELNANHVTLVSWALGSDGPFIQRLPSGAMQVNLKATPEQYQETFLRQLGGMFARIRREQIRIVRTAQDIDKALAGELRLVISTEGAHYLGGDIAYLDLAYSRGVRQIGLGHFVEGDITDIRTEPPKIGGLSAFGKDVIRRCNVLGILVDLAHSTDAAVAQALATSTQPMLWSHSNITRIPSFWNNGGKNQSMSVSLDNAKVMAERGGVIGVWPSRFNFDNPDAYIDGLQDAIGMVGADHVAFGTDMHGLAPSSTMMTDYSGMRAIVNRMLAKNIPEAVVKKVASENYGRLLKTVMNGRTASEPM